jgi:hypothetical protein
MLQLYSELDKTGREKKRTVGYDFIHTMLARYRKVQNQTSGSRFQNPVYSREMATLSIRKHEFESFLSVITNSLNVHIVDYSGKPDYFIILSNPTI